MTRNSDFQNVGKIDMVAKCWRAVALSLVAAASNVAHSEGPPTPLNPLWAPIAAPSSFLVPGSAHSFKGDEETSSKIFKWHVFSFGTFLASAVGYALTDGIGRHILKVSVNPSTQGVAVEVINVD